MSNSTRQTDTHLFFWNTIYSQWYTSSKQIFDGTNYFSSAEQAMMHAKAKLFDDEATAKLILSTDNPRTIKALGRQVKNFNDEEWNKVKLNVVTIINRMKFEQNQDLLDKMILDKDLILVEASPEDKIWGIGLHASDDRVLDESLWQGQNLLGIAIMNARDSILSSIAQ